MRLIGTLNDQKKAMAFSAFLQEHEILNQIEVQVNSDWGSECYGDTAYKIWILSEDDLSHAMSYFEEFIENSEDPKFALNSVALHEENEIKPERALPFNPPMGIVTRFLSIICILIFVLSLLLSYQETSTEPKSLFSSPLEQIVIYDYPETYSMIDQFITSYGYEALKEPKDLNLEGRKLLDKINHTPFWTGFYTIIEAEGVRAIPKEVSTTPMFEKIKAGEWWRVFTPALYHANLLHIFFNILWLFVLGKAIEFRLGPWRYLFFVLLTGIFSNTAQYLMGGPNFIGFSGILCAMLAFIWVRQSWAKENYGIDRMTFLFMFVYIAGMAAVQSLSFLFEIVGNTSFSPGIANTSHVSGLVIGAFLGCFNFFRWRVKSDR